MGMTIRKGSWNKGPDLAFAINKRVADAKRKHGQDAVINACLGTLADDDGNIIALASVYKRLDEMDRKVIASYAPIEGEEDYRRLVVESLFGSYKPKAYISAISTPGGTGAIRSAIFSYVDRGDPVICHDYYWSPYKKICEEFERDFKTYEFFDKTYRFNIEAFKNEVNKNLENKDRLAALINSPGNNPSGYSLSDDEWDLLIGFLRKKARDKAKRITLIVDVAYIEFAGDGDEQKRFFEKFTDLPDNLMVVVCYSMSKSHTAYGLRSGAAIGISSSKENIEEFEASISLTARCNWSNGTHVAQRILIDLEREENKGEYLKELEDIRLMLEQRADEFVRRAKANDLTIIPYFGGFFTFVPTDRAFEISESLEEENIFTIPSDKGIRVAICSVSLDKIPHLVSRLAYYVNKTCKNF